LTKLSKFYKSGARSSDYYTEVLADLYQVNLSSRQTKKRAIKASKMYDKNTNNLNLEKKKLNNFEKKRKTRFLFKKINSVYFGHLK